MVFNPTNTAQDHSSQFNFTSDDWKYFESYDDEVDREIYNHALQLFEADLARFGVTKKACVARDCWPKEKQEKNDLSLAGDGSNITVQENYDTIGDGNASLEGVDSNVRRPLKSVDNRFAWMHIPKVRFV